MAKKKKLSKIERLKGKNEEISQKQRIKTEKIRKSEDKSRIPNIRIVAVPERANTENRDE